MKSEKHFCLNHPDKLASNICHNCKEYYCLDCLEEGSTYFYCRKIECNKKLKEELYYSTNPVFCPECLSNTTSESAGDVYSINGFGTSFGGKRDICPLCNSYIQNKYFTFLFIPVIKKGSYRIKSISKDYGFSKRSEQYISRKIK